ncbi:minor tail protein [Gordonia phage Pupper]|uniref:Minor tail protein n=1 Tax=Gordonia phage Pupper TaxID=2571249 RepID=A0A4Y6EIQ7_9CAUD|nr:minor tail protein [Gordonia phage Pupper]QDF18618.1 minor tail protein [Gordonia phage Pupper]
MANSTKFYYDFNIPLRVVEFLRGLIEASGKEEATSTSTSREWFSQPRPSSDDTTEVVRMTFKLPLSISEVSMEILRLPCVVEVWYQDRSNNWRQMLDPRRVPLRVNVSRAETKSYYKFSSRCYPVVAKQVQIRMTRTPDASLENTPYVLGLKNTLLRRNVYDRESGRADFESETDVFGNVITRYVKDWSPEKAFDANAVTFWKSGPQPTSDAVVALYLDVRGNAGEPKAIDRLYLDPVYSGQHLNVYYSNDDTQGTLKLNPTSIVADADENTRWRIGQGRWDISSGTDESFYRWNTNVGPLVERDAWIGVEWRPDFTPDDGPAANPVLFRSLALPGQITYSPTLLYDVGAGQFTLQFANGVDTINYSAPLATTWAAGDTLRVVVGWTNDPGRVVFRVYNHTGALLATSDQVATTLPEVISFGGTCEIRNFRGLITSLVVKQEPYAAGLEAFVASPTYYVDPDPVIPDSAGNVPSTTLDNAILSGAWLSQEHLSGGASETAYEAKEWTPVWRNYLSAKGMMYFPQAISMKYIKLEFTNLTEEPYPIYEPGIQTRYKSFPVSVSTGQSLEFGRYTGVGGTLGPGIVTSLNSRSVNWLDPASIRRALGRANVRNAVPPVYVSYGPATISESLPNRGAQTLTETFRGEASNAYVFRRNALITSVLAEATYVTTINGEDTQQVRSKLGVPWRDVRASNPTAVTRVLSAGLGAIRGNDWWVFPGQSLKIPTNMIDRMTGSEISVTRKRTLEHRVRFNTTSVHRYDYRTITRDAAVAYFAGVREVVPYVASYIDAEDKPSFEFSTYDADQFVFNNVRQLPEGPITTGAAVYRVNNPGFDDGLTNWHQRSGDWDADFGTGHWRPGTGHVTATGIEATLASSEVFVDENVQVTVSCWAKWADIVADDDSEAIRLTGELYDAEDTLLDTVTFDTVLNADWGAASDSDWVLLQGTATTVAGSDSLRVLLTVDADEGEVWFDNVGLLDTVNQQATVFKSVSTMSTFVKAFVDFRDSGMVRSDSMWADIKPDSQAISDVALAPYVETIPSTLPGGLWGDFVKGWGDHDAEWGSPFGIVSVTLDGDRRYQGKRVLRFSRAAGAGEAGLKVKQWTNLVPEGLARIGCVILKPYPNDNTITLRLRRISDGEFIYEETFTPSVDRWFQFESQFFEIPEGPDQNYELTLTMTGDDEDEVLVNDLYTEVSHIRYFMRLGGVGSYLHEVTDLRYSNNRATVTTSEPVNQMTVQAAILSPQAFAFGATITPVYLK